MTSTLPPEVRDAFERFITCELTTVDARKQPITWPVTPYYTQGAPTIDLTTGLGYPKKADDAAAHPSVALLFSDPTGSGVDSGIRVLVQGTATIDDRDLRANADRYVRESGVKLPGDEEDEPAEADPSDVRLVLRPDLHQGAPGATLRLAGRGPRQRAGRPRFAPRGGALRPHRGAARGPRRAGAGEPAWDRRMEFLAGHETGVLSFLGPDGFPIAVRVPFRADPARRRILIEREPAGLPLLEGRACLTVHRHAPDFSWQRNMQVRGNLVRSADGIRLVPTRIVGGFELPEGRLRRFRDFIRKGPGFYKTYRRRLRERA